MNSSPFSSPNREFDVAESSDKKNSPHSAARKRRNIKNKKLIQNLNENLILNGNEIPEPQISASHSSSNGLHGDDDNVESMDNNEDNLAALHRTDTLSVSERSIHGQTRTSHAFWNLCKCFVGAASFALPWAVSKTGIIPGIVGFVFLAVLAFLTFRWMLISSHYAMTNNNPTYPELAEIAFSRFFPLFERPIPKNNDIAMVRMLPNDGNDDNFVEMKEEEKQQFIDKELMLNISNPNNRKYIKYNNRCGLIGKISVYLCMFFGMIGACGSYILFISGVVQNWMASYIDPTSSLSFYVSICIVLPFPICLSILRYKYYLNDSESAMINISFANT